MCLKEISRTRLILWLLFGVRLFHYCYVLPIKLTPGLTQKKFTQSKVKKNSVDLCNFQRLIIISKFKSLLFSRSTLKKQVISFKGMKCILYITFGRPVERLNVKLHGLL